MIGSYIERRHFGPDWAQRHFGPISDWLTQFLIGWPFLAQIMIGWPFLAQIMIGWPFLARILIGWPFLAQFTVFYPKFRWARTRMADATTIVTLPTNVQWPHCGPPDPEIKKMIGSLNKKARKSRIEWLKELCKPLPTGPPISDPRRRKRMVQRAYHEARTLPGFLSYAQRLKLGRASI